MILPLKSNITTVAGGNQSGNSLNQLSYNNSDTGYSGINDIFVDSSGSLFISDGNNKRVVKWPSGSSEGIVVASGNEIFTGIFIDQSGALYAADLGHKVTKWNLDTGESIVVAGGNGRGSSFNQLNEPHGIFVDSEGNVYVADVLNARIMKWAPDSAEGVLVAGGNGSGNDANQLYRPKDVFVHSSDDIYIADAYQSAIVKWVPGSSQGICVAGGVKGGGGFGVGSTSDLSRTYHPRGLYVTESRSIYVAETRNQRVTLWNEGDEVGTLVTTGNSNDPITMPGSVFVDNLSNIYVDDMINSRVLKLTYYPEIKINAGELTTTFEISAIEELPENNEDDEEIIMTLSTETELVKLASSDPTKVVIKNNTIEFEKKDNPFIELSKSSISWGDYDRDGDMDLAIMGQSNSVGAVTAIYENKDGSFVDTNQNFTNVYDGDISWVDLNKDGWLDLVVSGFNQTAKTSIYINKEGQTFETSTSRLGNSKCL